MFHLRRKDLTRAQFKQANLITGISLTLVYFIFFFLNFTSKTISTTTKFVCFGIYLVFYILMAVFVVKYIEERKAMLMCAVGFEVSYLILLLTTPVSSIFLIFPVMLIITVYLNEVLYMYGAVGSLILIMIKSTVLRYTTGYAKEEFVLINVAIICLIICFIGGFNAIRALVKFSKDETDEVNNLLSKQKAVASEVEAVTDEVAADFKSVVEDLERINENVSSTVMAIDQIAKGSEQTAQAATEQAGMTNEIQERLESTSQIAATAKTTSDDLKKTINLGRAHSEELEKQSKIVDEYETDISNTISELTKEVSEVTHITDTILSISAQTNLLALNASIEAARAGDAGRGFAVVAEEIRQLAEGTKKSTEMITQIMKELTAVTDKVQQAVEKSGESIAAQRDKISLVTESFNVVDKGIEELSTNVDQMNTEVVAVLEANNHIVDNVDTLAAVSEEMSSNAINSANDTTALGKSMEKFTEVIETTSAKISALREIAGK